jgi:hypothetical protein
MVLAKVRFFGMVQNKFCLLINYSYICIMPVVDITIWDARGQKEPNNQKWDRLLDENIEEICEMIVSGKAFKLIAEHFGVKAYYWWTWKKKTIHKELLDAAIEASAHTMEQAARDILVEGIQSGTQNMAEANLRRELSKALQFGAAKRNQAFYGTQKVEVKTEDTTPKLENKEEYASLLEELKKKRGVGAGSVGGSVDVKKNEPVIKNEKSEDGFTEFEEIK